MAERLGYDHDEALMLGKAVAGLNAQSKGRRLGIYKPSEKPEAARKKRRQGEEFRVDILGRAVPAKQTEQGLRAVVGDAAISPQIVQSYLSRSFGDELQAVQQAMESLAKSCRPDELARAAYGLYEQFRPSVPAGVRGWGAKGQLDLDLVRALAKRD